MTDKEKIIKELKEVLDSLDITNEYRLNLIRAIEYLQEEPALKVFEDMPLDPNIQYASREIGIKAHAEDYSFNIESELFQQLNKEQQELWRKEIEQACMSGGYCGLNLGLDKRYDKEEPVSKDFEVALAEMIDNAQTSVVEPWVVAAQWKDELIKLAKSEEPVSEELEEAAYHNCIDRLSKESIEDFKAGAKWGKEQTEIQIKIQSTALPNECPKEGFVSEDLEKAAKQYEEDAVFYAGRNISDFFKAGAKWQKQKDESTTEDLGEYINELSKQFPEVSFAKLSRIVVRVAKWQKEQMMAKAIDATCFGFQGAALFSFRLPASSYLIGSKVKVIVIKK